MDIPKIFISSAFTGLSDVRANLNQFVRSLGYEAILANYGDIAYSSKVPLDEDCFRAIGECDIFVLIIGTVYGTEISQSLDFIKKKEVKNFYSEYISITHNEYQVAKQLGKPIFAFVKKEVFIEFGTYSSNPTSKKIKYKYADNIGVFKFIDEIINARDLYLESFSTYEDILKWLKKQLAGMFANLLKNSQNKNISTFHFSTDELLKTTIKQLESLLIAINVNLYNVSNFKYKKSDLSEIENNFSQIFNTEPFIRFLLSYFNIEIVPKNLFNYFNNSSSLVDFLGRIGCEELRFAQIVKFNTTEVEYNKLKLKYHIISNLIDPNGKIQN